jgi:hypothetical protein
MVTVARHKTHLTYEMNIFIAMTFSLCAPGLSYRGLSYRTQHNKAEANETKFFALLESKYSLSSVTEIACVI